jgi:hypothetical protein
MLSQKLASLGRVLPDTQLAQLVLDEPELLLASRWVRLLCGLLWCSGAFTCKELQVPGK